jgi:hypothetical protein
MALSACLALALFTAAWPSVVSSAAQQLFASLFGEVAQIAHAQPSRAEVLQATADEFNKSVPQQIDPVTRLDRVRVEADQLVYECTLNIRKLTTDAISNLQRQVKSNALPAYCTGDMKVFRRMNVGVVYRYRYPDGEPVYQFALAERDCNP